MSEQAPNQPYNWENEAGNNPNAQDPEAIRQEAEAWVDREVASGRVQNVDPEADKWVDEQLKKGADKTEESFDVDPKDVKWADDKQNTKSWTEMSDDEQLAKAHADGYTNARKEGDTLVLGKKEGEEDTPSIQNLVANWAEADYNKDAEKSKQAQDAIQDYIIDAQARGIISEDEVSSLIDSLYSRKEHEVSNETERQKLLNELATKLAGLSEKRAAEDDLEIPAPSPLTDEEKAALADDEDFDIPAPTPLTEEEIAKYKEEHIKEVFERTKVPEDLQESLDRARKNYIELSAARTGKSFRGNKDLENAKKAYDYQRSLAGNYVYNTLKDAGASEEQLIAFSKMGALIELAQVTGVKNEFVEETKGIMDVQLESYEGKKFKKLYEFWGRQQVDGKGFTQKLVNSFKPKNWGKTIKKAAVMAPVGVAAGFGLAAIGASVVASGGTLGVAGLAFGRAINKGLVGAKLSKEAGAKTLAAQQAEQTYTKGAELINNADSLIASSTLSDVSKETTDQAAKNNRTRLARTAITGALLGTAGAAIGAELLDNNGPSGGSTNEGETPEVTVPGTEETTPDVTVPGVEETTPGGDTIPVVTAPGIEDIPEGGTEVAPDAPVEVAPELPAGFETNMPWTNAAELFESPDPRGLIQSTLDEYNSRTGHTFEWRQDGMFWEGNRVINPAELAEYNRVMAELATENSDTLPVTA